MSNQPQPKKDAGSSMNKTRELITVSETANAAERVQRDQETIEMVKRMNALPGKFRWSYEIVQGKVRVSIQPRV